MGKRHEPNRIVRGMGGVVMSELADGRGSTETRWLWHGWVPRGAITVLDGDPGLGKSLVTLDLAGQLTYERNMPDGSPGQYGSVVLLCDEDDVRGTLQTRLYAADAHTSSVFLLQYASGWDPVARAEGRWPVRLPRDLVALRQAIDHMQASLVIIDPLMAFLDETASSGREQDVYTALQPLARLARVTGVAMILVRHLAKGRGRDPLHWGTGSIGIAGVARSGLLVVRDPSEPEHTRLLIQTKNNLGPLMPTLRFQIGTYGDHPEYDEHGEQVFHTDQVTTWAHLRWLGKAEVTAATLPNVTDARKKYPAREEAAAFLREALREGPRPATEVLAEARVVGISVATLRRARGTVGIVVSHKGFSADGRWVWALPESASSGPREAERDDMTPAYPDAPDALAGEGGDQRDETDADDETDAGMGSDIYQNTQEEQEEQEEQGEQEDQHTPHRQAYIVPHKW